MRFDALVVFFFGIIVAMGGFMGYVKADSLPSLIMGLSFGVILVICSYGLWKKHLYGFFGSIATTTILTVFFMMRYVQTSKTFPAGVMALLSVIVMILLLSTKDTKKAQ